MLIPVSSEVTAINRPSKIAESYWTNSFFCSSVWWAQMLIRNGALLPQPVGFCQTPQDDMIKKVPA